MIPIILGSTSDLPLAKSIQQELNVYSIPSVCRVCSAHKAAENLLQMLHDYEHCASPPVLYITIAGKSNALSALIDGHTTRPVLACPPLTDAKMYDLYSSVSMPSYIAPMVVLNPKNVALAALKIYALAKPALLETISSLHATNALALRIDDVKQKYDVFQGVLEALDMYSSKTPDSSRATAAQTDYTESIYKGKVRDIYAIPETHTTTQPRQTYRMVATDRLSAFDRHITNIPFKGDIINRISAWWFARTEHIVPNHLLMVEHPAASIVKTCTVFPIEFVVRAYLTGSTNTSIWVNYNNGMRHYCGNVLPNGMTKHQKLPYVLVTPTTKGDTDELITPEEIVSSGRMTQAQWDTCREKALALFAFGQAEMAKKGLILVDTKYEFGTDAEGNLLLVDEIHTPDSSRYWLSTTYAKNIQAGKEPDNIDKEFIRKWIRKTCTEQGLDVYANELPTIPAEMVIETSKRYMQLYDLITGEDYVPVVGGDDGGVGEGGGDGGVGGGQTTGCGVVS